MQSHAPTIFPTPDRVAAIDRLGDEIALLSAQMASGKLAAREAE